jgi:type IV pilus assembly protein PilN
MIRINLLPHREEKRKARRQQFYVLLGMVSVLAGLIWFLGYGLLNQRISAQADKNEFLKRETARLDKEIEEIKKLRSQIDGLLSRKQVIEILQANRAETVLLFNELAQNVPEGIYLRAVKQTGPKLALSGYAQSNARITTLMNDLDQTELLESPKLIETKSAVVGNKRLNEFSIEVSLAKRTQQDADAKAGPAKAPKK